MDVYVRFLGSRDVRGSASFTLLVRKREVEEVVVVVEKAGAAMMVARALVVLLELELAVLGMA